MSNRTTRTPLLSGIGAVGHAAAAQLSRFSDHLAPNAGHLALLLVDPIAARIVEVRSRVTRLLRIGVRDVLVVGATDVGLATAIAAMGALPIAAPGPGTPVARLVRAAGIAVAALRSDGLVGVDVASLVRSRALPATAVAASWTTSASSPEVARGALPPMAAAVVLHLAVPAGAQLRAVDHLTREVTARCPQASVELGLTVGTRRQTIAASLLAITPLPLRQLAECPGAPDPHHVRGQITHLKHLRNTRGQEFARFRLQSAAESIDVWAFPDAYARLAPRLVAGALLVCVGAVRNEIPALSMMTEDIT